MRSLNAFSIELSLSVGQSSRDTSLCSIGVVRQYQSREEWCLPHSNRGSVYPQLLNILASAVGSLTNPTKLANTFSSNGMHVSDKTIGTYIGYLLGDFFILRASGNSMIDAGIENGNLVIVRIQNDACDGQIVVALVDNEATLKRFYRDRETGRIILHPENSALKDIVVDNCVIQGVAVKVIKDL